MEHEIVLPDYAPHQAFQRLLALVAARPDWSIITGGKHDHPRFVIERRLKMTFIRGVDTYTYFKVIGQFSKDKSGDTLLHYEVRGQPMMTALYAGVWLVFIPVIVWFILRIPTASSAGGTAFAISAFLIAVMCGYIWLVIRRYQGQLREMHDLMTNFSR